jgi:hypothetical protein
MAKVMGLCGRLLSPKTVVGWTMPAAAMVARPVKVRRLNLMSLIESSLDTVAGYGFICFGWLTALNQG